MMKERFLIGYTAADFQKQLNRSTTTKSPSTGDTTYMTYQNQAPVTGATALPQQDREDARLAGIAAQSGTGYVINAQGLKVKPEGFGNAPTASNVFATIEDAQAAAAEEYKRSGSVSPSTQAAIDRFNDPSLIQDTRHEVRAPGSPNQGDTERKDVNDPLSAEAGAMGKTGALGKNPLTVAEAYNVLATSRNPEQRKAAEEFINSTAADIKGYDSIPIYNDQGILTGYKQVENKEKTVENQLKFRETQAKEEENRLKTQEMNEQLKKFIAGIDTTAFDQTKTQLEGLMSSIQNLSPSLQTAILPQLLQLQQSNNEIYGIVNEITSSQPSDQEIEAQYGTMEAYILDQDQKYKAILDKNLQTAKEIAEYNKESLEIEKKIIDHDAAVAEQKQIAANIDGEKKLRRQLNALGIQTDVQGLSYLQSEIQKGVDALENLKTANNLVSLKAQLAIGEGYRLEVKQAMEDYEGKYLNITSQTTERLQSIKNSISQAKSDRTKQIIEAKKWGLEQKNENDKEARDRVSAANTQMREDLNQKRDDDRAKESLGWQILNTALDNYGSNIPESILGRVQSMLPPGTNLQDILSTPTLAERKKLGSGGSSSFSFSPSEMTPDGKPISFEDFVAQRKAEIKMKPDLSMEDVKRATDMKALKAEYDAKMSTQTRFDPNDIILRLEDRTKNSAKNVRENAQETVKKYLENGMYEEADLFVDGLGTPLSATERGDMIQALNARKNVLRIQGLLEEFGQSGPITGRLKQSNLWSVKQSELNALVTQTVPGLARGIFKEVGVLTDQDIDRYSKTIPNGKSTIEQSRALTNNLLETINMSIENQLAVMRDSGLNTRDLRTRFETLDTSLPETSSSLSQSQKDWLDSL